MTYASTFLSHSSVDKPLVEVVARELGRRGIAAWLDRNELQAGTDLGKALADALRRQATVTVFLSPAALDSPWVDDELAVALKQEEAPGNSGRVIPVYLGDPLALVEPRPLLRSHWLHPDGDRVNRLGIEPRRDVDLLLMARDIANQVARAIYGMLEIADNPEIIIYVDQRGGGQRRGDPPHLPKPMRALSAPALVFRPDLGFRRPDETLYGDDWQDVRLTMEEALSEALGGARWHTPKKIRILGNAQLGFAFFLGRYFNRNTNADLFCTNLDGRTFSNQGQPRHVPLQGGNPRCETDHPDIPPLPEHAELEAVSLLLSMPPYVAPVRRYLAAHPDAPPLVWVENGIFESSQHVMNYIADVVALLTRLNNENGLSMVHLYCGLPFHVVPLLAANLLNVVQNIIFMEYRRDLQETNPLAGEIYIPLLMK